MFDSRDVVLAFQAGEYEDGIARNSTFAEGDWNGDREFDSMDLVLALQRGKYVPSSVPLVSPATDQRQRSKESAVEIESQTNPAALNSLVRPHQSMDLDTIPGVFAELTGTNSLGDFEVEESEFDLLAEGIVGRARMVV